MNYHTAHPNQMYQTKWQINITPIERVGRIVIGAAGVVGGLVLLAATPTWLTGTLEVLLIAASLDVLVTGITGHCSLYNKLGFVPKSLRNSMRHDHSSSTEPQPHDGMRGGNMGHRLLMIACCIPMLLIAGALVIAGAVSASFLLYAVACTAMMALMMRGMHGNGEHK